MRRLKTLLTTLLTATALSTQAQPTPADKLRRDPTQTLTTQAQPTPADELRRDPTRSASNLAAYPGPGYGRLTPPPRGMVPVYLSHYGRHGSRYLSKTKDYDTPYDVLDKASRLKKLSPLGEDVLRRLARIRAEADNRTGELTPLGVEQHRQIARRMAERFPELLGAPDAVVDARSTLAVRCLLSMQAALLELQRLNPRLTVGGEACLRDQHFMNFTDRQLAKSIYAIDAREAFDDFCNRQQCWQRTVQQLFTDTAYLDSQVDGERLCYYLFRLASAVQNMELRDSLTLYDLFTTDEIHRHWLTNNAYWFLGYAQTPLNGGQQPFSQRYLLRRIIAEADSCLRLPHPTVSLRFGHDTNVLPLVCLMDINGYGQPIGSLDSLELRHWADYRVFPMACNIQLVFYRAKRDRSSDNILFKVLLNEREATLPLQPVTGPYYRWQDFRSWALRKLDSFSERN